TLAFRALGQAAQGDEGPLVAQLNRDPRLADWLATWRPRLDAVEGMDAVNPVYIPRNHRVEAALNAAQADDMAPFERLLAALSDPFTRRDGFEDLETPAPEGAGEYVTYCGT
ncbi:MAG: hypothetical protein KJZ59_08135, partial [Pararhodobacter sp.]|nr:hypothetical protein [Pararhodobacter sp.]